MSDDKLKSLVSASGFSVPGKKIELLEKFADLLIEKNQFINLAKISNRNEFLVKHILDSLFIGKYTKIKPGARVADLGTGGGLPGIPLAILNPDAGFTLIDSVQKKIKCVEEFSDCLGLGNVNCIADRLEDLGRDKKYREQFEAVTARALAPLPVLLELALPLVKTGGVFIAMKGPGYISELDMSKNAMKKLNIGLPEIKKYDLPENMGKHFLLIFRKNNPTPDIYPRGIGVPNKKPL